MSADSRSRFGSTLALRSPVVKRSGRSQDDGSSGSGSVSGSKRSVKDRLGNVRDASLEGRSRKKNKRQKGEQNQESYHRNSSNDARLTKGDLRFKIMENKDPPTDVDLRDKLSRPKATLPPADGKRSRPPKAVNTKRKSMLETRDIYDDKQQDVEDRAFDGERPSMRELRGSREGQSMRELRESREGQSMRELRGSREGQNMREHSDSVGGQSMREHGDSYRRQNMRELGDTDGRQNMGQPVNSVGRQSMGEVRDVVARQHVQGLMDRGVGRQSMGELMDSYNVERQIRQEHIDIYSAERSIMQEPWDTCNDGMPSMLDIGDRYDSGRQGVPGQIPSRIGSDLPALSHARTSYPSWTVDNVRRRSPDMMSCSSMTRTFSPDRNIEELQRRALIRTYDDASASVYRRSEVPSPHTTTGSAIPMYQPPFNAIPPMHAPPVPLTAPYPPSSGVLLRVVEQPTVLGFLQSLGLEKYAINFQHEEVDFHTLRQMTDIDMKELHIPMGPRKKILQALLPPPRR